MAIPGTDWLEVPIPYIRPTNKACVREYPQKIWPDMVQYLHFRILKFPLDSWLLKLPLDMTEKVGQQVKSTGFSANVWLANKAALVIKMNIQLS